MNLFEKYYAVSIYKTLEIEFAAGNYEWIVEKQKEVRTQDFSFSQNKRRIVYFILMVLEKILIVYKTTKKNDPFLETIKKSFFERLSQLEESLLSVKNVVVGYSFVEDIILQSSFCCSSRFSHFVSSSDLTLAYGDFVTTWFLVDHYRQQKFLAKSSLLNFRFFTFFLFFYFYFF